MSHQKSFVHHFFSLNAQVPVKNLLTKRFLNSEN